MGSEMCIRDRNMVLLAIFGDTASVEAALEEIKRKEKEGTPEW